MQWKCGEGPKPPPILVGEEDILKRQIAPPSGHQTIDTVHPMKQGFPQEKAGTLVSSGIEASQAHVCRS